MKRTTRSSTKKVREKQDRSSSSEVVEAPHFSTPNFNLMPSITTEKIEQLFHQYLAEFPQYVLSKTSQFSQSEHAKLQHPTPNSIKDSKENLQISITENKNESQNELLQFSPSDGSNNTAHWDISQSTEPKLFGNDSLDEISSVKQEVDVENELSISNLFEGFLSEQPSPTKSSTVQQPNKLINEKLAEELLTWNKDDEENYNSLINYPDDDDIFDIDKTITLDSKNNNINHHSVTTNYNETSLTNENILEFPDLTLNYDHFLFSNAKLNEEKLLFSKNNDVDYNCKIKASTNSSPASSSLESSFVDRHMNQLCGMVENDRNLKHLDLKTQDNNFTQLSNLKQNEIYFDSKQNWSSPCDWNFSSPCHNSNLNEILPVSPIKKNTFHKTASLIYKDTCGKSFNKIYKENLDEDDDGFKHKIDKRKDVELLFSEHLKNISEIEERELFPQVINSDQNTGKMFTADQLEELKSQLEIHFYLIANSFIVHKKDVVNEPTNYTFWENELREIYSRFSNSNDGETPLMKQKVIQSIPNLVLKLKGKHEIYKNNLRIKNSLFLQFNKKSAKLNCESDSFSESELNPSKISNTNIKGQKVLKKRENRPGTYKKWISSEDELLYLGLLCYGFTDFNFDNKMVSTFCLPGRNRKQIYDRIRYKTNRRSKPNRIKDLFLRPFKPMVELELYIMREGIRVYKGNFLIIAERLFPQIPRYLLKHTWEAMYLRREVSLNFILSAGLNIADYERPNSHDKMELLSSTTSCEGIEVKNAIPNVKSSSRKSKSKPIIKPNVPSLYLEKNSCKKLQNEKLKRQPFLPHKIPNTSLVNIGRGKMYVGKEYNHQLLNSSDVKSVSALKKSPQLMPTLLNFTPNTSALVANESSSDIDELNSARWFHRRNSTAGKNESLKMEYGLDVFSSPILNLQHKQSFRKSSVENKENIPFMAQLCQDSKKNIKQREKSVQRNLCDVFTGKDFGNNNVCAPHSNNSKEESQFLEKQKNIFMHQQHSLFSDYGDLNCNSLQLYNNSLVSPSNNNFYTKYSNQSNSINLNLANNMKRKNNQEKIQLAAINNSSLNKPVHIEKSKGNVIVRPFDSFKDNLNNPLMTRNTHGTVEPKTPGGNANLSEDTENLLMGKKRIKKDNTRREKSSKKIKVFGESNI